MQLKRWYPSAMLLPDGKVSPAHPPEGAPASARGPAAPLVAAVARPPAASRPARTGVALGGGGGPMGPIRSSGPIFGNSTCATVLPLCKKRSHARGACTCTRAAAPTCASSYVLQQALVPCLGGTTRASKVYACMRCFGCTAGPSTHAAMREGAPHLARTAAPFPGARHVRVAPRLAPADRLPHVPPSCPSPPLSRCSSSADRPAPTPAALT